MEEVEKSYNKIRRKYRFHQFDIGNNNDRGINFYAKNHTEQYTKINEKLYRHGNMEFIPIPYKPYSLWRLRWFFVRFSKKSQVFMQNRYIKYIIKYLIIPVLVILVATIIYDKYIKDII